MATAKYCSKECYTSVHYKPIEIVCKNCLTKFTVPTSRAKSRVFCSITCKNADKRIRDTAKEIRHNAKLVARLRRGNNSSRNTRRLAFLSKAKRCEVCGYDEYDFCLDIHHKDENPENRDIENLIVLCVVCHRKFHRGIIDLTEIENARY